MKKFEFLEHTADIKFKAYGKSLEELFENCVLAVSNTISKGKRIKPSIRKRLNLSGDDFEILLYNLINEIIYLLDSENFVPSKAKINLNKNKLNGEIFGDLSKNYKDLEHLKSATYSEIYVKKVKNSFESQAVIDI